MDVSTVLQCAGLIGRPPFVIVVTYTLFFALTAYGAVFALTWAFPHLGLPHLPAANGAVKWSFLTKFLTVALSFMSIVGPAGLQGNDALALIAGNVDSFAMLIGNDKPFFAGLLVILIGICLRRRGITSLRKAVS